MDIDIDLVGWSIQCEHQQRMFAFAEQAAISLLDSFLQGAGLYPASIDKDGHILAAALSQHAVADIAVNMIMALIANIDAMKHVVQGEMVELGERAGQLAGAAGLEGAVFVEDKVETDGGIADGIVGDEPGDMAIFGPMSAGIVQTGRDIIEQVVDGDGCAV